MLCGRSVQTEISASATVDLREVIARFSRLARHRISRDSHCLEHRIAQKRQHLISIAPSEFAIAGSVEVEIVRAVGATFGRNHVCRMDCLRKFVDNRVHGHTTSVAVCTYHLTCEQGHIFRFQVQVSDELVVDPRHLLGPAQVTCVALALMEQDAFDHADLLSLACQGHQAVVRIVAVAGEHPFHPLRCTCLDIVVDRVTHKRLDMTTADSHGDHTHAHVLRQSCHHLTTEIIYGSKTGILAAKWRRCRIPLPYLAPQPVVVDSSHHLESRIHTREILWFYLCVALHIALSEAEEDIEVGIRGRFHAPWQKPQRQCQEAEMAEIRNDVHLYYRFSFSICKDRANWQNLLYDMYHILVETVSYIKT